MEKFEGNSNMSKQVAAPEKRVSAPVANGTYKKENSVVRRLFAQDLGSAAKGVNDDIVIPTVKRGLVAILKGLVDYVFNGRVSQQPNSNYTNYGVYGSPRTVTYGPSQPSNGGILGSSAPVLKNGVYAVNAIEFHSYEEAKNVINELNNIYNRYDHIIQLSDYFELSHAENLITNTCYNFGWKEPLDELTNAPIESRLNDKGDIVYSIRLPKIVPLK